MDRHHIMVNCVHGYPDVEESPGFIFHSNMKEVKDPMVGNTVLCEVRSR